MKLLLTTKALLLLLLSVSLFACKQKNTEKMSINNEIEGRIDQLMDKMSIEEKVGQMVQYSGDSKATGPLKATPDQVEDVKNGMVGSMLNVTGAENVREMQKLAVENSRFGIPIIFALDVVHGYKTISPIPLAEACSWDLTAIEKSARIAAIEASAAGINWTFAPMVDIARDPRWGRVMEGAGEDTYYGSLVAAARVKGFQGSDLKNKTSIVACAKHFAGYGGVEAGKEYNYVDMSRRVMNDVYLPPFKAAVDAGVSTLMTSFNEFEGTLATANTYLLREKLKGEWGFNGFVVSDWNTIGEMVIHGMAENEKDAAELAITAGTDMDMATAAYRNYLVDLVKSGKVDEDLVDDAVRRILRIKFKLGLFDNPYKNCDPELEAKTLQCKEHLQASRDMARKSIVLLKNQGNILPLSSDLKKIAVVGALADSKPDMLGFWEGRGEAKDMTTILEGIKTGVSKSTKVLYADGYDLETFELSNPDRAISIAKESDAVVMVMGERWFMTGEASSRGDITIPGEQQQLLDKLLKTGKPIVVLLVNGRPLAIPEVAENAPAILETWILGSQAGYAVADVLFGKYNPSGKLTMSFPYATGQIPVYYNHRNTGRPELPTSDRWISHYLDIPNEPVFPFGFGLSYTTFEYSDLNLDKISMNMNGSIKISLSVTNTGKYDGEEVVQLYMRDMVASVVRPVKELKGFKKVKIKAGETVDVAFTLSAKDLAFYTKDMSYKAEPGEFKVFVGTNSVDCKEASFTLRD